MKREFENGCIAICMFLYVLEPHTLKSEHLFACLGTMPSFDWCSNRIPEIRKLWRRGFYPDSKLWGKKCSTSAWLQSLALLQLKPCFIVPAKNPVLREVLDALDPIPWKVLSTLWTIAEFWLWTLEVTLKPQLIGNNVQIDLIIGKYIFLRKGEPANPERKLF